MKERLSKIESDERPEPKDTRRVDAGNLEAKIESELDKRVAFAEEHSSNRTLNGITGEELRERLRPMVTTKLTAEFMGEVDEMTSLYNRSAFQTLYSSAIENFIPGTVSLIVMIDMDYLKIINDRLGHGEGDRILQELGMRLKATLRVSDFAGRLGGDELGVMLTGIPAKLEADLTDEEVVDKLDSYSMHVSQSYDSQLARIVGRVVGNLKDKSGTPISISVGCLVISEDKKPTWEKARGMADKGLYVSKSMRRGASLEGSNDRRNLLTIISDDDVIEEDGNERYATFVLKKEGTLNGQNHPFYGYENIGQGRLSELAETYEHCLHEVQTAGVYHVKTEIKNALLDQKLENVMSELGLVLENFDDLRLSEYAQLLLAARQKKNRDRNTKK